MESLGLLVRECGLGVDDLGGAGFEFVHRRVTAVHVVANVGVAGGLAHRFGGFRHRIGAEIGHTGGSRAETNTRRSGIEIR